MHEDGVPRPSTSSRVIRSFFPLDLRARVSKLRLRLFTKRGEDFVSEAAQVALRRRELSRRVPIFIFVFCQELFEARKAFLRQINVEVEEVEHGFQNLRPQLVQPVDDFEVLRDPPSPEDLNNFRRQSNGGREARQGGVEGRRLRLRCRLLHCGYIRMEPDARPQEPLRHGKKEVEIGDTHFVPRRVDAEDQHAGYVATQVLHGSHPGGGREEDALRRREIGGGPQRLFIILRPADELRDHHAHAVEPERQVLFVLAIACSRTLLEPALQEVLVKAVASGRNRGLALENKTTEGGIIDGRNHPPGQ
mmetsp:Transcript_27859/g.70424  ORF Transcript_27859/g.70424 Transcript_27859/m.70424 type:complete len:306 (+) Transcript_27859:395-1312(+)